MNLVDLVRNQLGGDTIGRIAGLLGLGSHEAKTAVDAAVPAMLASVAGLAESPDGARRLASTLDGMDDRLVGNISSALAGGGANSVVDTGRNLLGSLFGNNVFSSLGGALSRFTGLGSGAITSLLGLLAPMVLGTLKGQKDRMGLDVGGLSNLLRGQLPNITGAMPSGLSSALSSIPGLGALTGAGEAVRDTARDVAGSVYGAGRNVANTAARAANTTARAAGEATTSAARWLIPVAAALAVVGLIWWAVNRSGPSSATANPRTTIQPPVNTVVPTVDEQVTRFTGQVKDAFASVGTSLGQITDKASAEAAAPKLREFATQLDSLRNATANLPVAARDKVNSFINQSWLSMQSGIDRVMAIPGVSDTLGPTFDQIRNTVSAFTKP